MSENEDGNNQIDADFKQKGRKSDSECGNFSRFVCPVCCELLHEKNLPDMESVIYDSLYYARDVCIWNSRVQLYCDFEHRYDEEGVIIEEPHDLAGFIDAGVDFSGECIKFPLSEIHPAKKKVV